MPGLLPIRALGAVLAFTALPIHAAGLTTGRIEDSREDIARAAITAQDVVNSVSYEDLLVVFGPAPAVNIPLEPIVLSQFAPQGTALALGTTDSQLLGLFIFGGLAGLPAILAGGGGGLTAPPPTATVPPNPSAPQELPEVPPPPPPPPAVPEPTTWAMLLLGFGVIGAGLRRKRSLRSRAEVDREALAA